jgi:aminoglycoside phosphotransferase (APT) family kinase protein
VTWIEQSRALRASVPSPEGLARLGDALGEPVEVERPLHGGVATSVHLLRTPTRSLVLKRFAWEDAAGFEWDRLHIARAVPIATPEPIALDVDGTWFGCHALVLSFIPGTSMVPPDPEALGAAMAVIHATPLPDPVPDVLLRPARWSTWEPSIPLPAGAAEAIARLQTIAPDAPVVLAHCDLHPGNVIVDRGSIVGVVDWSNARRTTRGQDLGPARVDLAIDPGGDAPDRFLAAYEAAAGLTVEHVELWDVLAGARAIEEGAGWVDAWTEVGVPMTADLLVGRATAFTETALRKISGHPDPL